MDLVRFALALAVSLALLGPVPASAGRKPEARPLSSEHVHPSGAFSFKTPEGWSVGPSPLNPEVLDASGDGAIVRFLYRDGESGYDSLHVTCMLERLAGPMETHPRVKYEYDFLSGTAGERRLLDSAFVVLYDKPIQNQREWRQRNLTLVGGGQSLCVITNVPLAVWKKDSRTRALVDAVVASIAFRQQR